MARKSSLFRCTACGYESSGWLGRCPGCGEWNSLQEERVDPRPTAAKARIAGRGWLEGDERPVSGPTVEPLALESVEAAPVPRMATGLPEFDRVLGGGFVRGSLVLVGGDPGIGKSTLLLQACGTGRYGSPVLYISGEESSRQVRLRADRLKVPDGRVRLLPATDFEAVAQALVRDRPALAVVDSIQTLYSDDIASAPGSVSQVRDVTAGLLRLAKKLDTTIVLVGHVTKDGAIAGPRVLEHMVDTVLYFEGERHQMFRILRAVKNRFGATDELGIFEMREDGLHGIDNPSHALLSGRPLDVPGSVVTACMEGTRPLLVEIQALLAEAAYGTARRMAQGIDPQRVTLLMAVLEKRASLGLYNMDAYVNVVGGIRVDEPAADLAVVAAIAGSFRNRPVRASTLLIGEVGLTGEIRPVSSVERRVQEGVRLGFARLVLPSADRRVLSRMRLDPAVELLYADRIGDALDMAF